MSKELKELLDKDKDFKQNFEILHQELNYSITLKELNIIRELIIKYMKQTNTTFDLPITDKYILKEMTESIDDFYKCSVNGYTYIYASEWINIKPGLKKADPKGVNIVSLSIRFHKKDKSPLPLECIIHTFLHELTHTITLPEQHIVGNISNKTLKLQPKNKKKSKKYIAVHHPRNFYCNYAKILRIAEKLNIYILPESHRNFSPEKLQRYDSFINPSDGISIGYSPMFSKHYR